MASSSREFRNGAVAVLPIVGAVAPFAVMFGTIASQANLSVLEITVMSAAIYAGASQFVAVDLFEQSLPLWLIVVSVLAVNFRHLLYSAAMTPMVRALTRLQRAAVFFFLVDPQFAASEARVEKGPGFTFAWYMGYALPLYVTWVALSAAGAAGGQLIGNPQTYGIDMLLPVYFLALVMGFRRRSRWGAVVTVSAATALLVYAAPQWGLTFLGPPWHVTIGGIAGILVAVILPPQPPRPSRAAPDLQNSGTAHPTGASAS
ncbi:MAG: AzlC family ABC transporter permease [Pseudomonadota bacterium]